MSKPRLMGILNTTPDSFYDQGRYFSVEHSVNRGIEIEEEGADWIDIGGQSSRPGSKLIGKEEELRRVIPVLEKLQRHLSIPISIDTINPQVAKEAVNLGAAMINDITGFHDPEMQEIAALSGVKICVMHMKGIPENMQENPNYDDEIDSYLINWFEKRVSLLAKRGINENQIVIDPGIGFGKTVADNLKIIQNLHKFKALGFPVLLGLSRKSFIGKTLNKPPSAILSATIAMNTVSILNGADIIRVHDVKEHRDVIEILNAYAAKSGPSSGC